MAVRFLLGFFESCIQPAMMLMCVSFQFLIQKGFANSSSRTAMWYKREEQSVLNSIWYCMTGVQLMVCFPLSLLSYRCSWTNYSQKIGGLLAFGTSQYVGGVIKNWQLLFLALGCATCVWSFFIGFFLPDSPLAAKCYSEEDKKLMVERVRHNETGIENRQFKRYQVIETIQDPIVWCCVMLILVANLVIGGLGVFSNLIIEQFGFSLLQTELLNIAQGSWTIIVMVGSAWCSQRFQQTCLIMIVSPNPSTQPPKAKQIPALDNPSHRRNHRYPGRNTHIIQCRRHAYRLLLHAVLPRRGQHDHLLDHPQHSRSD